MKTKNVKIEAQDEKINKEDKYKKTRMKATNNKGGKIQDEDVKTKNMNNEEQDEQQNNTKNKSKETKMKNKQHHQQRGQKGQGNKEKHENFLT